MLTLTGRQFVTSCRRSGDRTQARARSAGRRSFLRRGRGAAAGAQVCDRYALTRTSLLVLDAHDLHVLMEREPRIAEHIREVARSRLGGDVVTRKGDLVVEELEEAEMIQRSAGSHSRS